MRTITLVSGLAALSLAACGQGGDASPAGKANNAANDTAGNVAAAGMPTGPTPGLWRVTTRMSGMPAGVSAPAVETCIREAKFEAPQGVPESSGMTCEQQSFRREGDAMVGHMVCTSADGMRTETDTRVSGDFTRNYTMEVKSRMTPPPSPEMSELTMVMTAERLGDCPAASAAE